MPGAIFLLAAVLLCSQPLPAQQASKPVGLQSSSVWERMGAFRKLKTQDPGFANGSSRAAIAELLERENALLMSTESPGKKSVGEMYGEGYSEYYAEVLGACAAVCDRSQPRAVAALVNGTYNSDSPYAAELARRHPKEILRLLGEAVVRTPIGRSERLEMLALAIRLGRGLSPADSAAARKHALDYKTSGDAAVRAAVVSVLAEVANRDDVGLVTKLAQDDPYSYLSAGKRVYPVRDAARRALPRMRPRTP